MNHAEYLATHAPEKSLPTYGKSFSIAAKLLPSKTRLAVSQLYAFCRAVDDIADESKDLQQARHRLNALSLALQDRTLNDPLATYYLALTDKHGLNPLAAKCFVESVATDCGPVCIQNEAELIRYCFGVAGTVGLMMCPLLGVNHKSAYFNAAALGIAMQMTNISRDVIEDAGRQRCYIPADTLPQDFNLTAVAHAEKKAIEQIFPAITKLIDNSEPWYKAGAEGFTAMPFATRQSIKAASRLYHKIGECILLLDARAYGKQRVVTSGFQKFSAIVSSTKKPPAKQLSQFALDILTAELTNLGID
jgi:15-cis-phytoene synthase